MKKSLFFALTLLLSLNLLADEYRTAIGLRGGSSFRAPFYGVSCKHFLSNTSSSAIDVMFNYQLGDYILNTFYVMHKESHARGLFVTYLGYYAGVGMLYNFTNEMNRGRGINEKKGYFAPAMLLGIEGKWPKQPILLGIDIKPMYNLIPELHTFEEKYKTDFVELGCHIRYIF